jgi:hypothetical protein
MVLDLLVSVARGWPIGTLLLADGPLDFAVRPLEGAPQLESADLLILDGQQRLTALYQALGATAVEDVYFVDLRAVSEAGEITEEHIRSLRRARFTKLYPTDANQAAAGLAPVRTLADDRLFEEWIGFVEAAEREHLLQARDQLLPGLRNYAVPVVRLARDIELHALAKIFETLNRTGVRLAVFDLMVARLYPAGFHLGDRWADALRLHADTLEEFRVDGIEVLKLIALSEHLRQLWDGSGALSIRGVREGDVLGLTADVVVANWDGAIEEYASALAFLRDECGMCSRALLPPRAMVLPLAVFLSRAPETYRSVLKRWVWACVFSQRYAQGANTQAVMDARDLARSSDENELPEAVARFAADETVLTDTRRRNESFVRGLLALTVQKGAKDWMSGEPLAGRADLEPHHVFPTEYLSERGVDPNAVMNFGALPRGTNRLVRGLTPAVALADTPEVRETLASHLMPPEPTLVDDWPGYAQHRFVLLLDAINDAVRG